MDLSEFESISPYTDEEAVKALSRVAHHPAVPAISKYLFPGFPAGFLRGLIESVDSIDEFQETVMSKVVAAIVEKTSEGLTYDGVGTIRDIDGKFLAISNHRDIILDPALTQWVLCNNKLPMTEICVGSNLLSSPTVEDLLRSNRMIKVIRGISARQLYLSSQILSKYIRYTITSGKSSVWIAQKEGRTKDGYDVTEQGLLKMFDMSGEGSFADNFMELNIVPMSISYEYEPCDARKAREMLISRSQKYVKKPKEDLHSILTGIGQRKGHIHLSIGEPLSCDEIQSAASLNGNERYQAIMKTLDDRIRQGYRLWKTNYIGYDLMRGTSEFLGAEYDEADREEFISYTEHKIGKMERRLDRDALREIFWRIYGNPVAARL